MAKKSTNANGDDKEKKVTAPKSPTKTRTRSRKTTPKEEKETVETVEEDSPKEEKKDDSVVKEEKIDFENLTVTQYFDLVKGMKQTTDSKHVQKMLDIALNMIEKFEKLGQVAAAKKATIAASIMKRDLALYEKGIKQYVHIDDVTKYIKNISNHNVKIIEVQNFPREIPEEIVDKWLNIRDMFDAGYIVFTDYTEESEEKDTVAASMGKTSTQKEVEKKRKEKDPILFGAIRADADNKSMKGNTYEKLYYIADWVDDYCDLTFDKMLDHMAKMDEFKDKEIVHSVEQVNTKEDFKKLAGL